MSEQNPISIELKRASWDSFLVAALFALMGVANLVSGSGLLIAFGVFQLFLSYANFSAGFYRREMASKITLIKDVTTEADQTLDT